MSRFVYFILAAVMTGSVINSQAASAQGLSSIAEMSFLLEPKSEISILGQTTVGSFRCDSDKATGGGRLGWAHEDTGEPFVEATLTSSVEAFDCKKGKITSDLHEALKFETHPSVSFIIDDGYAREATEAEGGDYVLRASGILRIAGVERRVDLHFIAEREGFVTFRLTGTHDILMSDYDIEPPSALLGLIRAGDKITVQFDLLLSPKLKF